jgi:hypothetical protein
VKVGDVSSAERGSQGWCCEGLGLKSERKRKATEGLLWLFLVTGEEEEERSWGEGAVAANLGFSRAFTIFYKCPYFFL